MAIVSHLSELQASLTPGCEILAETHDGKFVDHLKRWTDIDLKVPGAIVLPITEDDCQKIVQWASKYSIPFVTKSGGHSQWSTIGSEGIIVDLSLFKGIAVDSASGTATLKGSILTKDVAVALAETGLFTALGNGNAVGAIPYFLGGGNSLTPSLMGFGADQILSAHMITANGELLHVTEDSYPDLLFALRGAGQFFGLVTQLVVRCYPLRMLGNDQGVIWSGAFVFPLGRAQDVTSVMNDLMDRPGTSGMLMIMAPPPKQLPCLVVSARYTGDPNDAQNIYKPLYELQPIVANGSPVPIQNINDGREAFDAKGGFKGFGIVGYHRFDQSAFLKTVQIWKEMTTECTDAINCSFCFKWDGGFPKPPEVDSAVCLYDIRYFQNNIIWHTDPANRSKVDEYNNRCFATMRGEGDEDKFVEFQGGTRVGRIQHRYRDGEKLLRLRRLKSEWDPKGMFTNQLLE